MKIINKSYELSGNVDVNLVLISDIHYYGKKEINYLNKVLNNIKKLNPNFICIPGDLIDETYIKDEEYLINWLKQLSSISKVIISIGNHEFYINKRKEIYGLNKKLYNKIKKINNVYVLDNANVVFDNINFIGLTLPIEYYYDSEYKNISLNKYLENIKSYKEHYNILLCHTPIGVCNKEILNSKNIDLVLCGHMHGGIVPNIFRKYIKNRGFISPKKRLFPKYAYGHISIDNKNVIISSGIRILSHSTKFRIFNNLFKSEIVNIKLKKN